MFLSVAQAAAKVSGAGQEGGTGLSDKIASFFEYLITQIPSWIAGFIVFVLAIFAAKIVKNIVEGKLEDKVDEEHQEIMVLAGRVTYFGTLVLGITVALKIAGIDLTTILAAVAFGVGFALQDLIMNFLSGVMILVSRQFAIGDFIKVGSTTGKVMEIQTRATILKTFDGTKVIVPNSEIFRSQVTSFTTNPMRRIVVPLYISYDTDISYAIKIAMGVMKKHPKIAKKPNPSVVVANYGDSTIDLSARFWVGSRDGWFKVKSDIMHKMWDEFTEAGIVVPYNITHLETAQDTAEFEKQAEEITKKRMEEMKKRAEERKLSQAMEANPGAPAGTAPLDAQVTPAPAAVPAIPNVVPEAPAVAAVPIPITPDGEYADLAEIDDNG